MLPVGISGEGCNMLSYEYITYLLKFIGLGVIAEVILGIAEVIVGIAIVVIKLS